MFFRIHPYFKLRRDIKKNPQALRLAQIAEPLYSDRRFCKLSGNLLDERLTICCLLNWALTIAEYAVSDPMPLERIAFYERKLEGEPKLLEIFLPPFSGHTLEAHEKAAIWGAAFYWLVVVKQTHLENVLDKVAAMGLKYPEGHPYFAHFILAANNDNKPRTATTEKVRKKGAKEEYITLTDLEKSVMAFPTYNEKMAAFGVLNNILVGNKAWNSVSPTIRTKIITGKSEQLEMMVQGDYVVNKNVEHEVNGVARGAVGVNIKNE